MTTPKPDVVYRDTLLRNGTRLILKTFSKPQKNTPSFIGTILFEGYAIAQFGVHRGTKTYKGHVIDFCYPRSAYSGADVEWTFLPEKQYGPFQSIEIKLYTWLESLSPIELTNWAVNHADVRRRRVFQSMSEHIM